MSNLISNTKIASGRRTTTPPRRVVVTKFLIRPMSQDLSSTMVNAYLKFIHANIEEISNRVQDEFGSLSSQQINWKESPSRWSIAECLDHIMTTNRSYFSQFDALAAGNYDPPFWTRLPKSYHLFWSRELSRVMTPLVTRRAQTPKAFAPTLGDHDISILREFTDHQLELQDKLERLPQKPHDMIIIYSPAARFITYPLRDAIEIISNHETRHFNQAQRLLGLLGFPST